MTLFGKEQKKNYCSQCVRRVLKELKKILFAFENIVTFITLAYEQCYHDILHVLFNNINKVHISFTNKPRNRVFSSRAEI